MKPLRFLVMGAGAIGCFVGGSLAASGQEVTLVGRASLQQKLTADGLTLRRPNLPQQTIFPTTVTAVPVKAEFDFVLLTVKAPDTGQALTELLGLKKLPPPTLVSFQNGLGNEEAMADVFGPDQVIAGTVTVPIAVLELGVVEVSKAKGGLGLASLTQTPGQTALANRLATALTQAGLTTQIYADYRAMKWSKLLLNIVTNASCAILNQTPAQIIAQPELLNLEILALREAVTVMQAQGIKAVKLPGYPVDWLAHLVSVGWLPLAVSGAILRPFMKSGRGSKMPSLYLDLAAGRPTSEIQVLNGAIVQAGRQLGIPTPVNQALTSLMDGLVSGRLDWLAHQNQPDKLLQATYKNNPGRMA
jgi:2-dehydropantoate 2-reductase